MALAVRRLCGRRNEIYSFGLNLKSVGISRFVADFMLPLFDIIETRERETFDFLRLRRHNLPVRLSLDAAELYMRDRYEPIPSESRDNKGVYFVSHHSPNYFEKRLEIAGDAAEKFSELCIFAQSREDCDIARELSEALEGKGNVFFRRYAHHEIADFIDYVSYCQCVITERFHGGIIARALGIPYADVSGLEKVGKISNAD